MHTNFQNILCTSVGIARGDICAEDSLAVLGLNYIIAVFFLTFKLTLKSSFFSLLSKLRSKSESPYAVFGKRHHLEKGSVEC